MNEERLRFEIATKVMGIEVYQATYDKYERLIDFDNFDPQFELFYDDDSIHWQDLPQYPYNMSDCWQVIEQLNSNPVFRDKFGEWFGKVQLWTYTEQKAATLICRAILTLYGLQEEKEVDDYAIPDYN